MQPVDDHGARGRRARQRRLRRGRADRHSRRRRRARRVDARPAGGTEDETSDEYLERLAEALTILAPRPILPGRFFDARAAGRRRRARDDDRPLPTVDRAGRLRHAARRVARRRTCRAARPSSSPPTPARAPSTRSCKPSTTLLDARARGEFPRLRDRARLRRDRRAGDRARAIPAMTRPRVKAAAEAELAAWLDPAAWGTPPGALSRRMGFRQHGAALRGGRAPQPRAPACTTSRPCRSRKSGGSFGTADIALKTPGRAADAGRVHGHGHDAVSRARAHAVGRAPARTHRAARARRRRARLRARAPRRRARRGARARRRNLRPRGGAARLAAASTSTAARTGRCRGSRNSSA